MSPGSGIFYRARNLIEITWPYLYYSLPMEQAYIVSAFRSPLCRAHKGGLVKVRIDDVCASVMKEALNRVAGLDPNLIEDVAIGCAMPEGEQGLNVARNISLLAGIPMTAGAMTINRFCGSSLTAITECAQAIQGGNGDVFVAGGVESMSHIPMGGFNPSLNEKLMRDGAPKAYISMGETAEILAKKYNISRAEQDEFSLASHRKAVAAIKDGKFKEEIISVANIDTDEGPRADTSMEALAKLKPAFLAEGTVTAGNSSQITDGAAVCVIVSKRMVKKLKLKPLVRIVSTAVAGCDPSTMGEGPIFAVPKVLKRAGLKLKDIDLIELNEAFAAQSIAVIRGLGLAREKLNVNGGAIALGHPLGATGARIMATLIHALKDRNKEIGLETMCVGGGQGVAMIVTRDL